MISPTEIFEKANKQYYSFIKSTINNTTFFPLEISANKNPKGNLADLQKEIKELINNSKETIKHSYCIELKERKTKKYGTQSLPTRIYFENQNDYLKFIKKETEYQNFNKNITLISNTVPKLTDWAIQNIKKIIKYQDVWSELLNICNYFINNPKPNLYIRELPIKEHTKFVENHKPIISELLDIVVREAVQKEETIFEKRYNLRYAEPLVRFSILDKSISNKYFWGVKDISITISDFTNLSLQIDKAIIVENKTTIYTFLTLPELKNTIAIYGGGYNVATQKNITWLKNAEIFYWGDIDVQGFEILSQVRGYYPQTKSILMNKEIYQKFKDFIVESKPSNIKEQLNLTKDEYELYLELKKNNTRLEQEKISYDFVTERIKKI